MNTVTKIGLGLAAVAAVSFASGCADHEPAFVCGKPVDYKSMSSCKSSKGMMMNKNTNKQMTQ